MTKFEDRVAGKRKFHGSAGWELPKIDRVPYGRGRGPAMVAENIKV